MEYTPIKSIFRRLIRSRPGLTKTFFFALEKLFLRERYVKRELNRIIAKLPPQSEILDAGFGYGQYSYYLAKRYKNMRITALEIEDEYLDDFAEFIRHCGIENIQIQKADLTELKYNNRFDLIFCVDVMEHIEADTMVFHNFAQALKKGGLFLMHTPHIQGAKGKGEGAFVGEHVRDGYRTRDIYYKLGESGFNPIGVEYTYWYFGAISWILLQKIPITALNLSKLFLLLLPFYYIIVLPLSLIAMSLDLKIKKNSGQGILATGRKSNA
jgi:SAM-dependent methyltransferase